MKSVTAAAAAADRRYPLRAEAAGRTGAAAAGGPTNISSLRLPTATDLLVLLALFLILTKDYFLMTLGVRAEWGGIALLLSLGLLRSVGTSTKVNLPLLFVLMVMSTSWVGSSVVSGVVNSSSYYAALVVALALLRLQPRYLVLSLTGIVATNTLLQLLESITGEFLFTYVDAELDYDEKMYSTGDGSVRTKGLYGSPINAISVAMSLCFLDPRRNQSWLMLCAASLLGQGRLGLIVGVVGLLAANLPTRSPATFRSKPVYRTKRLLMPLLLTVILGLIMVGWAVYFGSETAIERMLEVASSDNSQNMSRVELWTGSLLVLSNYDVPSLLFGQFGFIKALQGATESDWFRLWLDNGVFCFGIVAFLAIARVVRSARASDWPNAAAGGLCILVMGLYPHAQSFPNGMLTWYLLLLPLVATPTRLDRPPSTAWLDQHDDLPNPLSTRRESHENY